MLMCWVGLGNPGPKYAKTRHNVGFDWLDCVVQKLAPSSRWVEKFNSLWLSFEYAGHQIHFLKPQTFMNESGQAVRKFQERHQAELKLVAVYDDIDLRLGQLKLREGGGDGGHRGVRSMIEHYQTADFLRLRIGVGRPTDAASEHVLSKFHPDEYAVIQRVFDGAPEQFEMILKEPLTKATEYIHTRRFEESK